MAFWPTCTARTMFWYPVQRQMLPSSSSRISPSLALGWFLHRSTALITMPGVQKPHCRPWHSLNAACMGCMVPSADAMPSMVVTSAPCACTASMAQDLTARPFTCTVQAPHWLVSQPTWVPVSIRCSRSAWTSRVLGGTSTLAARPLTVYWTCIWLSPGVVLAGEERAHDLAEGIRVTLIARASSAAPQRPSLGTTLDFRGPWLDILKMKHAALHTGA